MCMDFFHTHKHVWVDICMRMRMHTRAQTCIHMCTDMHLGMETDICVDARRVGAGPHSYGPI